MTESPSVREVARALLGTWPNQVAAWGQDGVQAYCAELVARGISPERALLAIRSYDPDADFPPSAAKLAQVARRDPGAPSGPELVQILWGSGGVMHARAVYPEGGWRGADRDAADDQARLDRSTDFHPRVVAFMASVGLEALKNRDPRGESFGEANRNWICREWDAFTEKANERGVAALLAGQTLDPLAALRRAEAKQIEEGHAA